MTQMMFQVDTWTGKMAERRDRCQKAWRVSLVENFLSSQVSGEGKYNFWEDGESEDYKEAS